MDGIPIGREACFIEHNLGIQIARLLQKPVNNCVPHKITPSAAYAEILNFIVTMNITKQDLIDGKIKNVYENIIYSKVRGDYIASKWKRVHLPILPNYLKTFNFKVCYDLLPCKTKFVDFGLDTDSRCNFCNLHPDTHPHIFSKCKMLLYVWKFLDKIMEILTFKFRFEKRRHMYDYMLMGKIIKSEEIPVVYLNTLVNHKIWIVSRKIQFEKVDFDFGVFKTSIIRSLEARKRIENTGRIKHCQKIECIEKLCEAAITANSLVRDMSNR